MAYQMASTSFNPFKSSPSSPKEEGEETMRMDSPTTSFNLDDYKDDLDVTQPLHHEPRTSFLTTTSSMDPPPTLSNLTHLETSTLSSPDHGSKEEMTTTMKKKKQKAPTYEHEKGPDLVSFPLDTPFYPLPMPWPIQITPSIFQLQLQLQHSTYYPPSKPFHLSSFSFTHETMVQEAWERLKKKIYYQGFLFKSDPLTLCFHPYFVELAGNAQFHFHQVTYPPTMTSSSSFSKEVKGFENTDVEESCNEDDDQPSSSPFLLTPSTTTTTTPRPPHPWVLSALDTHVLHRPPCLLFSYVDRQLTLKPPDRDYRAWVWMLYLAMYEHFCLASWATYLKFPKATPSVASYQGVLQICFPGQEWLMVRCEVKASRTVWGGGGGSSGFSFPKKMKLKLKMPFKKNPLSTKEKEKKKGHEHNIGHGEEDEDEGGRPVSSGIERGLVQFFLLDKKKTLVASLCNVYQACLVHPSPVLGRINGTVFHHTKECSKPFMLIMANDMLTFLHIIWQAFDLHPPTYGDLTLHDLPKHHLTSSQPIQDLEMDDAFKVFQDCIHEKLSHLEIDPQLLHSHTPPSQEVKQEETSFGQVAEAPPSSSTTHHPSKVVERKNSSSSFSSSVVSHFSPSSTHSNTQPLMKEMKQDEESKTWEDEDILLRHIDLSLESPTSSNARPISILPMFNSPSLTKHLTPSTHDFSAASKRVSKLRPLSVMPDDPLSWEEEEMNPLPFHRMTTQVIPENEEEELEEETGSIQKQSRIHPAPPFLPTTEPFSSSDLSVNETSSNFLQPSDAFEKEVSKEMDHPASEQQPSASFSSQSRRPPSFLPDLRPLSIFPETLETHDDFYFSDTIKKEDEESEKVDEKEADEEEESTHFVDAMETTDFNPTGHVLTTAFQEDETKGPIIHPSSTRLSSYVEEDIQPQFQIKLQEQARLQAEQQAAALAAAEALQQRKLQEQKAFASKYIQNLMTTAQPPPPPPPASALPASSSSTLKSSKEPTRPTFGSHGLLPEPAPFLDDDDDDETHEDGFVNDLDDDEEDDGTDNENDRWSDGYTSEEDVFDEDLEEDDDEDRQLTFAIPTNQRKEADDPLAVPAFVEFGGLLAKPKVPLKQQETLQERQKFYAQLQVHQHQRKLEQQMKALELRDTPTPSSSSKSRNFMKMGGVGGGTGGRGQPPSSDHNPSSNPLTSRRRPTMPVKPEPGSSRPHVPHPSGTLPKDTSNRRHHDRRQSLTQKETSKPSFSNQQRRRPSMDSDDDSDEDLISSSEDDLSSSDEDRKPTSTPLPRPLSSRPSHISTPPPTSSSSRHEVKETKSILRATPPPLPRPMMPTPKSASSSSSSSSSSLKPLPPKSVPPPSKLPPSPTPPPSSRVSSRPIRPRPSDSTFQPLPSQSSENRMRVNVIAEKAPQRPRRPRPGGS
ncbi:hypothetical protein HMI56_002488 [Coelomomyces lativittatus]|nr:hypothetical protein HMI56_002488 [Coelomomyces lativittatus]